MAEGSSNPEDNQTPTEADEDNKNPIIPKGPSTTTTTPAAQPPFVRPPPPPQSFDPAAVFMEAYECAKLNNNWNKVSSSLMIHPEWLTKIPEGRRWTMLHQIVFSGNVMHLNEVLALQASNPEFRLLCKAADDKTVREVATDRAHIHPTMIRRIERLVAVDQLLNNAKDGKWELVRQFIRQQPDIVNEKPPYRRYYLAHHLAYMGQLDIFKNLSTMCQFKIDLLAENKTVSQVAREHNHIEFAEYVESLNTESNHNDDQTASSTTLPYPTGHPPDLPHYSPGFYDDPGITIIPANLDLNTLFLPTGNTLSYPDSHHHHHHTSNTDMHFATHSLYQGPNPGMTTMPITTTDTIQEDDNAMHAESVKPKSNAPQMTDEQQDVYEKTVINNVKKMSEKNLLNSITCCITKAILHDPVVAADGFTYEREAILNWFEHSNRSPMTNQELDSLELKPNYAIKSILQLLHDPSASETTTVEKSKAGGGGSSASAK